MKRFPVSTELGFLMLSTLGVAFFAGWLWRAENQTAVLPPLFQDTPQTLTHSTAIENQSKTTPVKAGVVVHVVGAVNKPGVLTLPGNLRVNDAIRAAGGVKVNGDVHAINLAATLEDGQQIRVPTKAEVASLNAASAGISASEKISDVSMLGAETSKAKLPFAPVNVNTASAAQLESLPGVGPALAQRIIQHRQQHGRFSSVADLDQVKGLGPKKIEALRPLVRF